MNVVLLFLTLNMHLLKIKIGKFEHFSAVIFLLPYESLMLKISGLKSVTTRRQGVLHNSH